MFCFPYGGAGAASYRRWMSLFPEDVEVRPIEYPGRWTRENEPLCDSIPDLADGAAAAIGLLLDLPYVVMGYSFGALVAFEVLRRLQRQGGRQAQAFVPCAQRGPHLAPPRLKLHEMPDREMMAEMQRLYGSPAPVDPELLARAVPPLRTDLRARFHYVYEPGEPLMMPLRACGGSGDSSLPQEQLEAWQQHTSGEFSTHLFKGGHFFITEHGEALRDVILTPAER